MPGTHQTPYVCVIKISQRGFNTRIRRQGTVQGHYHRSCRLQASGRTVTKDNARPQGLRPQHVYRRMRRSVLEVCIENIYDLPQVDRTEWNST